MIEKKFIVNGVVKELIVDPEQNLAEVLRSQLMLTSCKVGCGEGQCGACNVIIDGRLVRSCVYKMSRLEDGAEIMTLEGLGNAKNLHPLQEAWIYHGSAQCGFCSPGFLISSKALLDENPDPTRQEVRDWFQRNRNACRCTGYKPLVDAVMDAAAVMRGDKNISEIRYKAPKKGSLLGSRLPRPTAIAKVTGQADYGGDLAYKMPEGTLHLAVAQAEVEHAKILNINTSKAEKMPGVHAVLTHKDVKGRNRTSGLAFPTNKGDGWDRPILCDEKIFQYGDVYAIVCADTECQARAAAEKVELEYETLPAYTNVFEAMAPDAIEIHPGTPNIYFEQAIIKGEDTKPIFEKADIVVEADFKTNRQPHFPIEPDVGFAYMNEDGKLVIHSKSIAVHMHRAMICEGLGLEPSEITMRQNFTGGTFGYKFSPTMEVLVGVAAMATNRPCHFRMNYEQQMNMTGKRSPFFINLRYAADKKGNILGMESDWSVDHGAYSEFGDLLTLRGAQFMGFGYKIDNIRGLGRCVCTNHCWGAAYRAFGTPQSMFAQEVLLDMLAEKINKDPLELRFQNCLREGDTTPTGQKPDVYSMPEMFDTIKPIYEKAKKEAAKASTDKVKRGVGLAYGVCPAGLDGPDTAECEVELMPGGKVKIDAAWGEHGQGSDSGILGNAHEALLPLSLSPEDIIVAPFATTELKEFGPAGGSRSQVIGAQSIRVACEKLLEAMKKEDGTYMSYDEMKKANKPLRYEGIWSAPGTPSDEKGQGDPFYAFMHGVFLAEVAVEMETGKTTVEKMTLVADAGVIINKLITDGQLYGGISQGIGMALYEDYQDVKKDASLMGAGFPYINQIPDNIDLHYVETPRPLGAFGSSSIGELPNTAGHAAIVNGIHDACGAWVTELPALPERILEALKNKNN